MTENNENIRTELQRVLDTYGADRSRWPAELRASLDRLLESDAASRRLLAEARALDRVLDKAPLPAADRMAALTDRIMGAAAAASAQPARSNNAARVIPLPRKPAPVPANDDVLTPRTAWQAAGLIAACLLAGIYIGAGSSVLPLMQDVAESVGIVADLDPNTSGLGDLDGEDSL